MKEGPFWFLLFASCALPPPEGTPERQAFDAEPFSPVSLLKNRITQVDLDGASCFVIDNPGFGESISCIATPLPEAQP